MDYLADGNIDLVGVCVSKSRLLTFLLSELLLCPRSHSLVYSLAHLFWCHF